MPVCGEFAFIGATRSYLPRFQAPKSPAFPHRVRTSPAATLQ